MLKGQSSVLNVTVTTLTSVDVSFQIQRATENDTATLSYG